MKLNLTAEYEPSRGTWLTGAVLVKVNDVEVLALDAVRKPGAEPDAEGNVIMETIAQAAKGLQSKIDADDPKEQ